MGIRDFFKNPPPAAPITQVIADANQADLREKLAELQDQVQEATISQELIAQQAEDLAWTVIGQLGQQSDLTREVSHHSRIKRNQMAELTWREDPVLARAVEIHNDYVWAGGMPVPMARDPRVDRIIKSFWNDEDNKLVLTSYEAQIWKGIELRLFGELFLLVYDQGKWTDLGVEVSPKPPGDIVSDDLSQVTETNGNGHKAPQYAFEADFTGGGGGASAGGAAFAGFGSMTSGSDSAIGSGGSTMQSTYIDDLTGGEYAVKETGPIPPSAVKLGQMHPNEIWDIIPDGKNRLRPRHYKQVSKSYRYDYRTGAYVPVAPEPGSGAGMDITGQRVLYYESLQFPPRPDQPEPHPMQMGLGKVLHVAVNKTSFSFRGNSEVWRAVKWANALQDYFQWRLTLLRALATFPFKKKVKGGVSAVTQAALRLTQVNRGPLSPALNTASTDPFSPPPVGSILTENLNENLEQMKVDSGAGNAKEDILAIRSQVGVGLAMPPHYIGDVGSANLANATQMETPVLKSIEARQELFRRVIVVLLNFCIDKAIHDETLPKDVNRTIKVDMPNILARNVPLLINAITQITARLDPFALDMKLKRWMFAMSLTYLGVLDPKTIVDQVYPPDAQPLYPVLTSTTSNPVGAPGGAQTVPPAGGIPADLQANPPGSKFAKLAAQPIEKVTKPPTQPPRGGRAKASATEADVQMEFDLGDRADPDLVKLLEESGPVTAEDQVRYTQAYLELLQELQKIGTSTFGTE